MKKKDFLDYDINEDLPKDIAGKKKTGSKISDAKNGPGQNQKNESFVNGILQEQEIIENQDKKGKKTGKGHKDQKKKRDFKRNSTQAYLEDIEKGKSSSNDDGKHKTKDKSSTDDEKKKNNDSDNEIPRGPNDSSDEDGNEVKSYKEKQFGTGCQERLEFIANTAKVVIGYVAFVHALNLAIYYDIEGIPQFVDTKLYYAFMSLFLVLNGLDSILDTITDMEYVQTHCINFAKIVNIIVALLYLPFIGVGFTMAFTRLHTSWEDRQQIYIDFDESMGFKADDSSSYNTQMKSYMGMSTSPEDDAEDLVDSLKTSYLTFSILAVFALITDIYQATRLFVKCKNTHKCWLAEYFIFSFCFGLATIIVTWYYCDNLGTVIQQALFSSILDYDSEGKNYSNQAGEDIGTGADDFYALLIGFYGLYEGLTACWYHFRKIMGCDPCCCPRSKERIITKVQKKVRKIWNACCTFQIFCWIVCYQLIILLIVTALSNISFDNANMLFISGIVFDMVVGVALCCANSFLLWCCCCRQRRWYKKAKKNVFSQL